MVEHRVWNDFIVDDKIKKGRHVRSRKPEYVTLANLKGLEDELLPKDVKEPLIVPASPTKPRRRRHHAGKANKDRAPRGDHPERQPLPQAPLQQQLPTNT